METCCDGTADCIVKVWWANCPCIHAVLLSSSLVRWVLKQEQHRTLTSSTRQFRSYIVLPAHAPTRRIVYSLLYYLSQSLSRYVWQKHVLASQPSFVVCSTHSLAQRRITDHAPCSVCAEEKSDVMTRYATKSVHSQPQFLPRICDAWRPWVLTYRPRNDIVRFSFILCRGGKYNLNYVRFFFTYDRQTERQRVKQCHQVWRSRNDSVFTYSAFRAWVLLLLVTLTLRPLFS